MLLFMDGFDHYATADIGKKWSNVISCSISTTQGRRGGGALNTGAIQGNYVGKSLPASYPTLIVGFAFNPAGSYPSPSNQRILEILDGSTTQCSLVLNVDGTIIVWRGSTAIGATTASIPASSYSYIEVKITFHPSAGTVDLRVNGSSVLSLAGLNTRNSANSFANLVRLGQFQSAQTNTYFDDFYICDTSGTANNNFLGDVRIDTIFPSADGTYSQFTTSTGTSHNALVKETVPSTADYVAGGTVGFKDSYALTDLTGNAAVLGVQVNTLAYKDDAGFRQGANFVRSGTTDGQGASVTLSTSPGYMSSVHEIDPATSAAWTPTAINALEAGVVVTG